MNKIFNSLCYSDYIIFLSIQIFMKIRVLLILTISLFKILYKFYHNIVSMLTINFT